MRRWMLVFLFVAVGIGVGVKLVQSQQTPRVQGLPGGEYDWVIYQWNGRLFLVSGSVNLLTLEGAKRYTVDADIYPFSIYRIDAETERVVEQFQSKHFFPIGITAEREQRSDSWLSQNYDLWVVDNQRNLAYATKPREWSIAGLLEDPHYKVFVIDLQQRQVQAEVTVPPVEDLSLSSDGRKLYVGSGKVEYHEEDERWEAGVAVISTETLTVTKKVSFGTDAPAPMVLSRDGSRLFCVSPQGLAVLNTATDELEAWDNNGNVHLLDIYQSVSRRNPYGLAIATDERELYVGLQDGDERGAVAAIDLTQKKVVRVLELSPRACTSVAVVGNKLFAACLDGVYAVDINQWRGQ